MDEYLQWIFQTESDSQDDFDATIKKIIGIKSNTEDTEEKHYYREVPICHPVYPFLYAKSITNVKRINASESKIHEVVVEFAPVPWIVVHDPNN